jgi:excisionase family DNA binding protein
MSEEKQAPSGYVTTEEIAAELGVSRQAVYKWVSEGKLEAFRFGRAVRIPRSSYRQFVEASRMTPGTGKAAGRVSVQAA